MKIVMPKLRDPRITLCVFLTGYTILGQTLLYFNRDIKQLVLATGVACLTDMLLAFLFTRTILFPISAYITGLSIGLLLESYDARIFVLAAVWGVASKYFIRLKVLNSGNFLLNSEVLT